MKLALTLLIVLACTQPARAEYHPKLDARWRVEGGFGMRVGSFLVNNMDPETRTAGHVDLGVRRGRWAIYGEYGLMSVSLPADDVAMRGIEPGFGRGLLHRAGANTRYAFGRKLYSASAMELYVEGGIGVQHFRWDDGGYWTRPDLSLGFGMTSWGGGDVRHVGYSVGLRMLFARRSDAASVTACGGPCDAATAPTGIDRAFMMDMTLHFGT